MMRNAALAALLTACACAPSVGVKASRSATQGQDVQTGLEILLSHPPEVIRGKRVGLITNHTGVDRRGRRSVDLLAGRREFRLVALFAFEHGLRGTEPPGARIASGVDEVTGLPVHSLYGNVHKPTPEMLRDVDVLVYDVQDVGARTYTRVSTMALSMEAAAEKGISFLVLDRPNPLGGLHMEGPVLDTSLRSFVGMYPIPLRHGMTLGELARMYNERFGIGANLTVIPMAHWRRAAWFDETGLPWVNTSPNIRSLEAALLYPGMVLLEGTNLSEGRGTDAPFQQFGAPWFRASDVARAMNAIGQPGIRYDSTTLVIAASAGKFAGLTVPGVRITVTNRDAIRPVRSAILLLETVARLHPEQFVWLGTSDARDEKKLWFDRLAGTRRVRLAIADGTVEHLLRELDEETRRFGSMRQPFLIYQ